jgi:hypothetical protein
MSTGGERSTLRSGVPAPTSSRSPRPHEPRPDTSPKFRAGPQSDVIAAFDATVVPRSAPRGWQESRERAHQLGRSQVDCVLPSERIDTTHPPSQFAARYGFATKPSVVRFRPLSPLPGWPAQFTDVTIPARDFTALDLAVDDVYIVENETTYLAFPERPSAIVVWGVGYAAAVPADSWLTQRDTHYWGDLDTHGFSILDRIRTRLPNARSLLMDTETLLTYRVHWGHEANPSSLALPRLTNAERDTYQGLAENRWGDNVRLEQEHIPLDATLAS